MSYRRQQRRQGVRYGPPRVRERPGDNGELVGRMVGLGILLLTLGILAAGALAFLSDRRPATGVTSRTPPATSRVATSGPGATGAPLEATPIATLTPLPLPSNPPSFAAASIPPPEVQVGAGFITFGTRADEDLRILDPRASFAIDERITWSAFLIEPANSADLRIQIYKIDGTPPTGERLISDEAVTPDATGAQVFRRQLRPNRALDGSGIYVVRYVRGPDILSEGSLEITD